MSGRLGHAGLLLAAAAPAAQAWNPADKSASVTLSGGDRIASVTAALASVRSVTGRDAATADHYAEMTLSSSAGMIQLPGIALATASLSTYPGGDANGRGYYSQDGQKYVSNVGSAYGISFGLGTPTIGIYLKAGALRFYVIGSGDQGVAFSGLTGTWYLMWGSGTVGAGTRTANLNTGQSAFLGSLPSGASPWG